MPHRALGPRVLLRQLREVMARSEVVQDRLDKIVEIIAANVVAEVCSIYVLRGSDRLELFATKGLKREAVHKTSLKIGEGLVGTIARDAELLNLSEAQSHPSFKYMPETGEEIFQSFLGVPIFKNGKPIGVLVVQNQTKRHYSIEEEEAVQTTAMVLAEIFTSSEMDEWINSTNNGNVRSQFVQAKPVVAGIAMGHVVLHEPRVVVTQFVAEDVVSEHERLNEAILFLRGQVDHMIHNSQFSTASEHGEVLETYRMFANDRGWVQKIESAIDTGLTAEAGVERVQNEYRARLLKSSDSYLRERMTDLDDLANRLLRILAGRAQTAAQEDLPDASIVVARTMGPAELLDYDSGKIRGLILEDGGANSHVAIVARALEIPVVGEVSSILSLVEPDDAIIIDGTSGEIHVRPGSEIQAAYVEKIRFYARKQARYAKLRDVRSTTRDGHDISLNVNAGLMVDLPHLEDSGADGIGLFRTELQFMIARSFPRFDAQVAFYRSVLEAADDKPVVFRSLDIGSDKMLPYLSKPVEENPALGWRGLRMSLARPAFMTLQVRALLKAAESRHLYLMFPFVGSLEEYEDARQIIKAEVFRLKARGNKGPRKISLGVMIEIPSIMWQLDDILPEVDFVSIGSNDFAQYLFAADRTNADLAHRFDVLSPIFLRAISQIVRKCKAHGVPLSLCGEMASNPLEAMALIGIGLTSISMAPASIGPVKEMILSVELAKLQRFVEPLVGTPSPTLRPQLHAFARGNNIAV